MRSKTKKLIWAVPLLAVFAVAGALAMFASQVPGSVFANPLPGAPTDLMVSPSQASDAAGRTTLVLTWKAPAGGNVTGYRIDKSDDRFEWEALVADTGNTNTTYSDATLRANGTRYYRVFALNSHGLSPVSTPNGNTTNLKGDPGLVQNLTATANGRDKIDLKWDAPADDGGVDIEGYLIRYYNGSDWVILPGVSQDDSDTELGYLENKTSFTDEESLDAGEVRHYRVYAYNGTAAITSTTDPDTADGFSEKPVRANATTQAAAAPDVPTGLTAVNASAGTVNLYWYAPANDGGFDVTHYIIQARKDVAGVDWKTLPKAGSADTEYDNNSNFVTGADPDNFTIRIAAPDASNVYQHQFTNVDATHDHDGDTNTAQIALSWRFRIFAETFDDGNDDANSNANTNDDVVRRSATPYETAVVRAVDRANPDPLAAVVFTATGGEEKITLTTTETERNLYRIDVSEDAGVTWKSLQKNTIFTGFSGADREYEHQNLPYDVGRHYRIFTVGSNWRTNVGLAGAVITANTTESTAPGTVTGVTASAPDLKTIQGTLQEPEDTGGQPIDKYKYEYVIDDKDGFPDAADWLQVDAQSATIVVSGETDDASLSFTIKRTTGQGDLDDEKMYHIRFKAVNKAGGSTRSGTSLESSSWSKPASFTTGEAAKPGLVDGLTSELATDSSGNVRGVNLLWNKPTSGSAVTSYLVQRKIGSGQFMYPSTDARTLASGTTSYTDSKEWKTGDDARTYRVAAKNAEGTSEWVEVMYPRTTDPSHQHIVAKGTIPMQTVTVGGAAVTVDATMYFDGVASDTTYTASSSDAMVASTPATAINGMVTITGVAPGMATITVEASDGINPSVPQTIAVTVEAGALTAPTGITAMADGSTINVEWTNGVNAMSHVVLLMDTTDYSLAKPSAAAQTDGKASFDEVPAGTYVVVVVAVKSISEYMYDYVTVEVTQ